MNPKEITPKTAEEIKTDLQKLIENYKERLIDIDSTLHNNKNNGSILDHRREERLTVLRSEKSSIIVNLEKIAAEVQNLNVLCTAPPAELSEMLDKDFLFTGEEDCDCITCAANAHDRRENIKIATKYFNAGLQSRSEKQAQPSDETTEILKDALFTLKWMFDNMKVVDPNLQSDSFNLPANTINQIELYFERMRDNFNPSTEAKIDLDVLQAEFENYWKSKGHRFEAHFMDLFAWLASHKAFQTSESKAVEFAEWIVKSPYQFHERFNVWMFDINKLTTKELYTIFLSSKGK